RETSGRLADTAAMLQLVLDTIPSRIFWKDTSLKYLGCNLSLARDAGREKPEDLIGDTDEHMAWAEQAELYTADDRAVISSGQARIGYEEPQTTPAGNKIWLRTTKVPLRDSRGNIIGVMGTYEDITARKQQELNLARIEAELRAMLYGIGEAVISTDADGRIMIMNRVAEHLTGWLESEAAGQPLHNVFNIIDEQTRQPAKSRILRVLAEGRGDGPDSHTILISRDGTARPVGNSISPFFDKSGKLAGVILIFRDLTEEIKISRQLLRNEQIFRMAALSASNVIWEWDIPSGTLNWFGDIDAMLGLAPNEFPRTIKAWEGIIHPEDSSRVINALAKHLETSRFYSEEYRILRKDGQVRFWRDRGQIINDASAKPLKMIGAVEDITARKIAENERMRMIRQLRETNSDLETFASTASHDLHEPLRMVAGFAALFRKKYQGALDAEADRYIAYIVDGVTRMHKLIADILKLARAGINRRKPFLIHAGDALDDALHNLEVQIASRDALLSMDEMPDVWFEHVELCQVFQNLIANALKFARRHRKLFIHIGARNLDKEWEFSVSDNGIGMKPEDTAKIFMPFERLHESDEYPGSGIGLSICKKIVEHYGGQIRVESRPGHGSTFFFTIPKIVSADTHISAP
ncbi:MAG: PAS domain S-box protein, partial [Kiritimatiellia bacterium]